MATKCRETGARHAEASSPLFWHATVGRAQQASAPTGKFNGENLRLMWPVVFLRALLFYPVGDVRHRFGRHMAGFIVFRRFGFSLAGLE